jgi:hypothetical protein
MQPEHWLRDLRLDDGEDPKHDYSPDQLTQDHI